MKILHVITRLIVGGAQQNTVTCCRAQAAAGHEVALIFGPIYGPEGSLLEDAQKTGARVWPLRSLRRPVLPAHDLLAYWQLRRRVRQFQPDVVHTHSSKAGIVGRAAAWAEHTPAVIHTIHGLPFYPGQPRLVYRGYVGLERWAAQRCHKLIGVTRAMCTAFKQHGIGSPEQFEVVPSGVEMDRFHLPPETRAQVRRELGIPPEATVVGLVARLDKLKGQEDLLDIFPRLQQHGRTVWLLFVGDGWHRQKLQARVRREGLQERVIFTGLVSPERVAELLTAMDINTLPSYQEGQPRTLIQALLCGCAIVGYDAGGIPEICRDGQTGRLVRTGDREALATAILQLLQDPDLSCRLVAQGRQYVREHFDHRIMITQLERIYAETLAKTVPCAYRPTAACGETR